MANNFLAFTETGPTDAADLAAMESARRRKLPAEADLARATRPLDSPAPGDPEAAAAARAERAAEDERRAAALREERANETMADTLARQRRAMASLDAKRGLPAAVPSRRSEPSWETRGEALAYVRSRQYQMHAHAAETRAACLSDLCKATAGIRAATGAINAGAVPAADHGSTYAALDALVQRAFKVRCAAQQAAKAAS